jgi:hypothetical protein
MLMLVDLGKARRIYEHHRYCLFSTKSSNACRMQRTDDPSFSRQDNIGDTKTKLCIATTQNPNPWLLFHLFSLAYPTVQAIDFDER